MVEVRFLLGALKFYNGDDMNIIDHKDICEFIIRVYGFKEPVPYDEDWDSIKHYEFKTIEQAYCAGHVDGQTAGIDRVIERIEQLMKILSGQKEQ